MAFRPFISNLLGLDGSAESGGLLYSYVLGTSTPLTLYSDAGVTPDTNPVVADSLGQVTPYFNDTLSYSWRAKTADGAVTLWEANVVAGALSLTYINPAYEVFPLIEASWAEPLAAPLGEGWADAFADDFAEQTGSVDPADSGAEGDARQGTDGAITVSDATYTSASLNATSADIGKVIVIDGAGTGGLPLRTTIASINSTTSVELATTAITGVASGGRWTVSTNDTTDLQTAMAAAVAANLWLDLRGRSYGVIDLQLPVGIKVRDGTFIDLAPDVDARQTVECIDTLTGEVWLENITIDRNGGVVSTTTRANQALRCVRLKWVKTANLKIIGNDINECCKFDGCAVVEIDGTIDSCQYVTHGETDDVLEAFVFESGERVTGRMRIRKLGRTDQTSASRYRFTRGAVFNNIRSFDVEIDMDRVDQPFDVSGRSPSIGIVRGITRWAGSAGGKLANAKHIVDQSKLIHIQPGLCGVLVGGPDPADGDWPSWPNGGMVSGVTVINPGTSQLWSGHSFGPAGVMIIREAVGSATFPKGITVSGNYIDAYQGSVTFTIVNGSALLTFTQENGVPIQSGQRIRLTTAGSLAGTGFATATDYWLVQIGESNSCYLASSFNNAQDADDLVRAGLSPSTKVVTATSAGTGTHTLTLQQDMKWKVSATDVTQDADFLNIAYANSGSGYTTAECLNIGEPVAVIASDNTMSIADSTITDLKPNQGTGTSDPSDLYDPSTGVFSVKQTGLIALIVTGRWSPVSGGLRRTYIYEDTGSGFTLVPGGFTEAASAGASAEVPIRFTFVGRYAAGDKLKVAVRQDSGGSLNIQGVRVYFGPLNMLSVNAS